MITETRYCRGCNQSFSAPESAPRCPQCGLLLTLGDVAPTTDLDATEVLGQAAPPTAAAELSQTLLGQRFDSYTIETFLGKGGMAWVFRALHNTLYRPCAIKVLPPDRSGRKAQVVEVFLSEARAAASVVHPHIVTVHNVGQTETFDYIELEYVPGKSLQQIVREEGRLDPYRATDMLAQACSALAEAHRCGLVHRDFKPSNILVNPNGLAKLADFGLAKRVARAGAEREQLAGTPYFMAPELFQGTLASKASDVYAVGVSYYHLLTGEFPFVERHVGHLAELHAYAPVPDPQTRCPDVPAEAADLIRRCLAKQPDERPPDGTALCDELLGIFRAMRSLPALVAAAVGDLNLACHHEPQRIAIDVPQPNGRSQRVFVEDCVAELAAERVVKVYSLCGRAHESYYRRALELNAAIAHGSLAIERVQGEPCFVMVNAYPRRTCDPEEIRHSVREIARWADEVERVLTGNDRY